MIRLIVSATSTGSKFIGYVDYKYKILELVTCVYDNDTLF